MSSNDLQVYILAHKDHCTPQKCLISERRLHVCSSIILGPALHLIQSANAYSLEKNSRHFVNSGSAKQETSCGHYAQMEPKSAQDPEDEATTVIATFFSGFSGMRNAH